jgi:hypothetical protein
MIHHTVTKKVVDVFVRFSCAALKKNLVIYFCSYPEAYGGLNLDLFYTVI